VHGRDGLDEITTTAETDVAAFESGRVRTFVITPEDVGIKRAALADLKGGDAEVNAAALRALLRGAAGAYRDIALLNAAAALVVAGKAADLKAGVKMAAVAIDSGRANALLERWIALTNQPMADTPV